MNNYLQKAYCMNESMRIYAAITTDMINEVKEKFNMWPSSLSAFGKTLTMAAIMSSTYKNNDFLNIYVNGDGPIGKMTIEANDGCVRGFVQNPGVCLNNNDGTLNIKNAIGNGTIDVIKDLHMRYPFQSTSEIVSGDITNDFAYYFAKSEQIPSAVSLAVKFDKDYNVVAAGGYLIQVMPGCKDEEITKLENLLKTSKSLGDMISEGYNTEDIIRELTDHDYKILETKELKYECNCSKERFEKGLMSLGSEQIEKILVEDKKAEITCNFCNKKYEFSEQDLKDILVKIDAKKQEKN